MSLRIVAKKEFLDTQRSYTLATTTVLFVLWAGFLAAIRWVPPIFRDSDLPTTMLATMNSMQQSAVFFVPLIGLLLGYAAVVDDQDTGRFKLVLSLPHSRADVIFGKWLGRSAVVALAVAVGYGTAGVIALLTYSSFPAGIFLLHSLLTIFYCSVYVALGVGLSVFMPSREAALGVLMGLYALFLLGWDLAVYAVQLLTIGSELPAGGLPDWIQFFALVNPSTAFAYAAQALVPEFSELMIFPESEAVFLQNWVGLVVLVAWLLIPLTAGYLRFERLDLA